MDEMKNQVEEQSATEQEDVQPVAQDELDDFSRKLMPEVMARMLQVGSKLKTRRNKRRRLQNQKARL